MRTTLVLRACAAAVSIACAHAGLAQSAPSPTASNPSATLERRINLHAHGASLRDVFVTLERIAGLRLNPLWIDEDHAEGLDPERLIQVDCSAQPAIQVLEAVLRRADSTATWQLGVDSAIEVGPRSRLNE